MRAAINIQAVPAPVRGVALQRLWTPVLSLGVHLPLKRRANLTKAPARRDGQALARRPRGLDSVPGVLAVIFTIFWASTAQAAPDQDQIRLGFGKFEVWGTYSKRSCAAQTFLKSKRGSRMGFTIYWVPGKNLYLGTKHPGFATASGKQTVQFRFPDGQAIAFRMKTRGDRAQASIGFGSAAKKFYKMIEANPSLRIELPTLGDALDVSLKDRRQLEAAMRHCRDWLKS